MFAGRFNTSMYLGLIFLSDAIRGPTLFSLLRPVAPELVLKILCVVSGKTHESKRGKNTSV